MRCTIDNGTTYLLHIYINNVLLCSSPTCTFINFSTQLHKNKTVLDLSEPQFFITCINCTILNIMDESLFIHVPSYLRVYMFINTFRAFA